MAGIKIDEIYVALGLSMAEFSKGLGQAQSQLKKFSSQMNRMGRSLSKAFTVPLAGIGIAAGKAALDYQKAVATIRTGTGATGDALKSLEKDFKAVFTTVPQGASQVSSVLADLNTRTGLVGEPLQNLTRQIIDFSRVSGSDASQNVALFTRALGDWGIATEDASGAMDFLWKVSQTTGIGVGALQEKIVKFGAPLRQFGIGFEEAAVLMGKFEKEGVNTDVVFSGLRALLPKLAKEGIPLAEGFKELAEKIKEAGSAAEANAIAISGFGSKAGPDMAAAIREGRFEIDALLKSIQSSDETVAKAAASSLTFTDKLQISLNKVTSALAPLGLKLLDIAGPVVEAFATGLSSLLEWFNALPASVQDFAVTLGTLAAAAGPAALALGTVATMLAALAGPVTLTVGLFAGIVAAVWTSRKELWIGLNAIGSTFLGWADYVMSLVQALNQAVENALKGLLAIVQDMTFRMVKWLQEIVFGLAESFAGVSESATQGLLAIHDGLSAVNSKSRDFFTGLSNSSEKYVKQIEAKRKSIQDLRNTLNDNIHDAVFSSEVAESAEQATKDATAKGFKAGVTETVSSPDVKGQIEDFIKDGTSSGLKKTKDDFDKMHTDAADAWSKALSAAIPGLSKQMSDSLGSVFDQLLNEFDINLTGSGGVFDGVLNKLFSDFQTNGFSLDTAGSSLFGEARPEGVSGPLTEDGNFTDGSLASSGGYVDAAGLAVNNILSADDKNEANNDHSGTGAAVGAVAGAVIGSVVPVIGTYMGAVLGSYLGEFAGGFFGLGPSNPETLARIAAFDAINEAIGDRGIQFFDEKNRMQTIDSFDVGAHDRFNTPGWADQFKEMFGDKGMSAFSGAGNALQQLLGISEDVGSQIGFLLAEQTGGSLEALGAIFESFGVTVDQYVEALMQSGKIGEETWLEVVSNIRDSTDIFSDGIEGLGQFTTAYEQLLGAEGKGAISLKKMRAIISEGLEAEIKTVDELLARMGESGEFSAGEMAAITEAFRQQGTQDLAALADATDYEIAQMVAAIDAGLQDAGESWRNVTKETQEFSKSLEEINGKDINVDFKVHAEIPTEVEELLKLANSGGGEAGVKVTGSGSGSNGEVEAFAKGGIISSPTVALMGEAGKEVVAPLARGANGDMGIKIHGGMAGGMVINIDARGAAPGVEASIYAALENIKYQAVNEALEAVNYMHSRGGF